MVLYTRSEEEISVSKSDPVSEQGKAIDPIVEHLFSDVEDYSLYFTDSFPEFGNLNDWIDQSFGMEASDFGVVNAGGDEFSVAGAFEQVECSGAGVKIESLNEPEKSELAIFERSELVEKGVKVESGEFIVKEESLIEKEMEKVSLDGVSSVKENDGVANEVKNSVGNSGGLSSNRSEGNGDSVEMSNGNEKGVGEDESSDDSDSESESESSSSSSSSSSASSSDDDDDEEEDSDEENRNRRDSEMEEGEIQGGSADEMVAWSGDDDDIEENGPKGPIKSKNELKDLPFVPAVNVTMQPHHQTLPVGNISSIVGAQVIVEGVEKHNPLNEGSILWITESRSPLGIVDEIFGPVKNPFYIVRYNSEDEIPSGIQQGTSVCFVQEFANHVLNDKSLYKKGYDASGENDEELSEDGEFSDDEKEAEYRRMMKMKKRGTTEQKNGNMTMEKKKVRNRQKNQKHNQDFAAQTSTGNNNASFAASNDQVNSLISVGQVQVPPGNGSWSDPSCGIGTNSIPCQQPQSPGFPPFPLPTQSPGFVPPSGVFTPGVPPQQQQQQQQMAFPGPMFPPQPFFNMPFPNMLPFQQLNQGPMFPPNIFPGGQPSFGPGSVAPGQGIFNQTQLGLGLQGQTNPLPMNFGQQPMPPNVPQNGSNSGTPDNSWNSNQPRPFHSGRQQQTNHRGRGGRFRGGGRGRRQNN